MASNVVTVVPCLGLAQCTRRGLWGKARHQGVSAHALALGRHSIRGSLGVFGSGVRGHLNTTTRGTLRGKQSKTHKP